MYILFFIIPGRKYYFPHTGPKVPHSRPAQKRKCIIFGLGVRKNSIRSTGVKLASLLFQSDYFAFSSQDGKWYFRPGCNETLGREVGFACRFPFEAKPTNVIYYFTLIKKSRTYFITYVIYLYG